ncbi:MAG: DUF4340 domain-containing protein [Deltaproteobacteria bacterium]|nr:DUF4340 domain-containing protein [Deltaproteobacteria bacterium]
MKGKKEILILVLIIAALSTYLVLHKKGKTNYILPKLPPVTAKDVTRLHIHNGKQDLTLKKVDDRWVILPRKYPADPSMVKEMVDGIVQLNLTALTSESGNYNLYDLEEDKRIDVQLYQGDKLLREVGIGKVTSSRQQTFVKLPKEKGVYLAEENLSILFNKKVPELRDKEVLPLNGKIRQVILSQGKQTATFVKSPTVTAKSEEPQKEKSAESVPPPERWQTPDGKKAEEGAIDEVVAALTHLRCDGFIEDSKGLKETETPIYSVKLKGTKTYTVRIFKKVGNRYRATSSESPYPFYLSEWKAERIMKDPAKLVVSAKAPASGGTAGRKEKTANHPAAP